MASQWIRWNSTTHIYELSLDNGGTWNPLPLDGSVINQGTIDPARLGTNIRISGEIIMWPTTVAPTGWQLCDGTSLLRASFPDLFAAIGTTFGAADGTHFSVPDFRQKFPLGKANAGTGSIIGATGGAIDHTHSSAGHTHTYTDVVNHTHTITDPGHTHSILQILTGAGAINYVPFNTDATTRFFQTGFISTDTTGITGTNNPVGGVATGTTASTTPGSTGSNNPPFLAINFIIKT